MTPVLTKTYGALPLRRAEILRYARCPNGTAPPLLEECIAEAEAAAEPGRVCYRIFDLAERGGALDLGFATTTSAALRRNLQDCRRVLVFAATAGLAFDRLISRYSRLSVTKSLFFQAIGTERVEAICDRFCADMAQELGGLRPRFSPGYGDLPLALQTPLTRALDCARKAGITLNESLLMTPSKSVTAIAGIMPDTRETTAQTAPCARCAAADCAYRRDT
ncbi:MAG: Vitamin B12 dependent methionine synthase activation subunit [Oscillospiraceae bacterium]|nr:Vitamin B12 dependent methionine synthase activation subunit [Oscillospiraceae bacterium]